MPAQAKLFRSTLAALVLAGAFAAPFTGVASASVDDVITACSYGASLDGFSKSELQAALGSLPADQSEYSGCGDMISAALLNKATKGGNDRRGGADPVKRGKSEINSAGIKELTTRKERDKLRARADDESELTLGDPLDSATSPDVTEAAGKTLASSAAPDVPAGLAVAVLGLLLLIASDVFSRVGRATRKSGGSASVAQNLR